MLVIYCLRRLKDFLVFSDYDAIQLGCAFCAAGCGWVLAASPDYLATYPLLHGLLAVWPQAVWRNLLFFVAALQGIIFLLSGKPLYFSRTSEQIIMWTWISIVVEWGCVLLWGFLTFLMWQQPPTLIAVCFTLMAGGTGWASIRLGGKISQERVLIDLRRHKRKGEDIAKTAVFSEKDFVSDTKGRV